MSVEKGPQEPGGATPEKDDGESKDSEKFWDKLNQVPLPSAEDVIREGEEESSKKTEQDKAFEELYKLIGEMGEIKGKRHRNVNNPGEVIARTYKPEEVIEGIKEVRKVYEEIGKGAAKMTLGTITNSEDSGHLRDRVREILFPEEKE